ncbi:MAG: COX15/CtaA family protein [Ideonella sp.]
MTTPSLVDLSPLLQIVVVGGVVALGPLAWVWIRHRHGDAHSRLFGLSVLALFLTFDLVLFGAFTRLTDSGLGCPDWPGCYGSVSPFGASQHIDAAQMAMPTGPVTHGKAWVEMVHRYLATGVGLLIVVLAVASWLAARRRRLPVSPWWATLTLLWVCTQGAFGALTVTMKLYPAIVTLHLLGGLGLLMLLAVQSQGYQPRPWPLAPTLRRGLGALLLLVVVQAALGGWVSTNYAVLACRDFPSCQGQWWPQMDFEHGFALLRPLGMGRDGGFLPFQALTAIHMVHRIGALVVFAALAVLVWRLWTEGSHRSRGWARVLTALAAWQFASGLSNVVLDWPLAAALAHTGGAAALVTALTVAWIRSLQGEVGIPIGEVSHAAASAGRALGDVHLVK